MFPVKGFDEHSQKLTPPLCKLTELTHLRPNWSKPVITLFLERRGEPRGANKQRTGRWYKYMSLHPGSCECDPRRGEVCHLAGREDNYLVDQARPSPCLQLNPVNSYSTGKLGRSYTNRYWGWERPEGVLYVLAGLILAWVWLTTEMLWYVHFYVPLLEYFYIFDQKSLYCVLAPSNLELDISNIWSLPYKVRLLILSLIASIEKSFHMSQRKRILP